jgi:carboxymethylenebutenolidase
MRQTCDELADKGYIAGCPDLFWRLEPGLDLSHWPDKKWKKGLALYARFDFDAGVRDVASCIATALSLEGSLGRPA